MNFSKGDIHAFASSIVRDLQEAGVQIVDSHIATKVVVETLLNILPNEERAAAEL